MSERRPGAAIREQVTEALRERYLVEHEIAVGGMATVFQARDLREERTVAIKVMHPRLAIALGAERFLREVAVAQSMTHPLIVPLLDSGIIGPGRDVLRQGTEPLPYYVMPHVEGETLFERLQRQRRLPLSEAIPITSDVAGALGYAHRRGVLHRDVKPENVLLAGGRAILGDFGLARAIGAEYTRLTRTGVIVGTVHYMSPEQLREEPDLDQRADIYSLGCILYEMLTGGPPYVGVSLKELISRILHAPIPSARLVVSEIPPAVDAAIARALAKSPSDRFRGVEEFVAALNG